jgi:hypothetical protein
MNKFIESLLIYLKTHEMNIRKIIYSIACALKFWIFCDKGHSLFQNLVFFVTNLIIDLEG